MKKLLLGMTLAASVLTGCSEEFTETVNYGTLDPSTLGNAEGVELLLISAYSALDGINARGGADWHVTGDNWWFDALSDDAHKGSTDGDQGDLYQLEVYDWTTNNAYFGGKWNALFAGINRSNGVITTINSIDDGKDYSAQMAEARFLRGHFNYELQKIWGNVPYISDANYADKEFNQPNPGPIWDAIEADFQYAAENLPASQGDVGRPNKYAAQAYLGKAHAQQGDYTAALPLLESVINSGAFSLLPEFADNFRAAGDTGSEALFSIQFFADAGVSNNGNRGGTLAMPGGGPIGSCCGFYQPTQDLFNAYETNADGLPIRLGQNGLDADLASDYGITSAEDFTPTDKTLDPRVDYTVGRRGIDFNAWGVNPGKDWIRADFADISGPYLAKKNFYWAGEDSQRGTGGWGEQRSGINYHIIRYADVLLLAAESAVESGDLAKAMMYVNEVRSRAKNMTYVKDADGADAANYAIELYSTFPDVSYASQAVAMERRLELAMEGKRLFDLRRYGNSIEVINRYMALEALSIPSFADEAASKSYQSKHDLMPIPIGAIDASTGTLQQNYGY
jgi:hypothetical protein